MSDAPTNLTLEQGSRFSRFASSIQCSKCFGSTSTYLRPLLGAVIIAHCPAIASLSAVTPIADKRELAYRFERFGK